jgi:glycosyltransferase involved in cell wall biosynthesis
MSQKSRLSVILLTKNEERNIADCLEGVRWAEEIIVVDAESTDKTVEIAKQYTSKVFIQKWSGYAAAKDFALRQTHNEWVLWLDADERVSSALAQEIQTVISRGTDSLTAYAVARRAFFLGKWIRHCGWYPAYVVRLFQKSKTKFINTRVHEKVEVVGKIGKLNNDLLHYTDDTLFHYFFKFNRYTSLAAEDLFELQRTVSSYDIIFRAPLMFFKMYVLKLGFLDGIHGFILSLLSASYVFIKYAKLWELHWRKD